MIYQSSKQTFHKALLRLRFLPILALGACAAVAAQPASPTTAQTEPRPIGYSDTPYLPGGEWRVHDIDRPRPEIVTPGEVDNAPPSDAIILFDGTDLTHWETTDGGVPTWIVKDGVLTIPATSDKSERINLRTKEHFGDVQLHIEWRSPETVLSNSQGRGNSGVQFFEKYEVQILDSYDNPTYADGQASSIYGYKPPLVNASRPPGVWQSYDIIFEAPEFSDDGQLIEPAYVTVLHNGVLTQHRESYLGPSAHKKVAEYAAHAARGPLKLQHHGDAVSFRNIWIRDLSAP